MRFIVQDTERWKTYSPSESWTGLKWNISEYTVGLFIKLTYPEKRKGSICDASLSLRVHFTSWNIIAVIQDGVNSNYSFEKDSCPS